jgi:biotin operon repressor
MTTTKSKKEIIEDLKIQLEELKKSNDSKEMIIQDLNIKLENSKNGSGRKSQVLDLLRKYKSISILQISNELSISTKNVSSQLTYLRTDGYAIYTDPNGKKMLIEKSDEEEVEVE